MMSTYTNYVVNVKENLCRTRNPGCSDDGICEQRVIFSNPDNIYNGKFIGELSAYGSHFSNVIIDGDSHISDAWLNSNISIEHVSGNMTLDEVVSEHKTWTTALSTLSNDIKSVSSFISSSVMPDINALSSFDISCALSIASLASAFTSADSSVDELQKQLSNEISARISSFNVLSTVDDEISSQICSLSNEVSSMQQQIIGGLKFQGVVSVGNDWTSLSSFLQDNFQKIYGLNLSEAASYEVKRGFFYPVHSANALSHYNVEGLAMSHGDWLIANDDFIVSTATSSNMSVFDAQDAGTAKLDEENTFTRKNVFASLSAASVSCNLQDFMYDSISSMKDLSDDAYSKIAKNTKLVDELSATASLRTFLGSVDTEALYVPTLKAWFASIDGIDEDTVLYRGSFARSDAIYTSISSSISSDSGYININDYLILNKDTIVSAIDWNDVNVIRQYDMHALLHQAMHYRGDLSNNSQDFTLSSWLINTYKTEYVKAGDMNRVSLSIDSQVANGGHVKLHANDYILFKNDATISCIALSDFNVICDAMVECSALSVEMVDNDIALSNLMVSNDMSLSTAVDSKIFIDGISAQSLCAVHISQEDFYEKVITSSLLSNELYIVSGDYVNMYGQQVKNVAEPVDLDDAVTKNYVDIHVSSISDMLSNLSIEMLSTDQLLSNQIITLSDSLSTLSSLVISNDQFLSTSIDSKIFIDGISAQSLCAVHISQEDFYEKVITSSLLSNELYIVSSDYINAYQQQIKNVAEPVDFSDAVTKEYVDELVLQFSTVSPSINLSAQGKPADAKATGDALAGKLDSTVITSGTGYNIGNGQGGLIVRSYAGADVEEFEFSLPNVSPHDETVARIKDVEAVAAALRYRIAEAELTAKLPDGVTVWTYVNGAKGENITTETHFEYYTADSTYRWDLKRDKDFICSWNAGGTSGAYEELPEFLGVGLFDSDGNLITAPPNLLVLRVLADRTVNLITTQDSTNSVNVILPKNILNYVRDIIVKLDLSQSSSDVVTLNVIKNSDDTNITWDNISPNGEYKTNKTYLFRFTETSQNTFYFSNYNDNISRISILNALSGITQPPLNTLLSTDALSTVVNAVVQVRDILSSLYTTLS